MPEGELDGTVKKVVRIGSTVVAQKGKEASMVALTATALTPGEFLVCCTVVISRHHDFFSKKSVDVHWQCKP